MNKNYEINLADCTEPEEILRLLLLEDIVFINNGWWQKGWPVDAISVHLNCNDTFGWACADAEDVKYSDLKEIFEFYCRDEVWGPTAWCIKKRKMMPIPPVSERMQKAGWNLEELINEQKN